MLAAARLRHATSVPLDVVFWALVATLVTLVVCALLPTEVSTKGTSTLTPTAKEVLLSLDGTTFTPRRSKLRVIVKDLDGGIKVSLWPPMSKSAAEMPVPIRTDGDAAHFYWAITGEQHPALRGKLSQGYRGEWETWLEGKRR